MTVYFVTKRTEKKTKIKLFIRCVVFHLTQKFIWHGWQHVFFCTSFFIEISKEQYFISVLISSSHIIISARMCTKTNSPDAQIKVLYCSTGCTLKIHIIKCDRIIGISVWIIFISIWTYLCMQFSIQKHTQQLYLGREEELKPYWRHSHEF